jgi:serine/threonine-protein kinase
VLTYLHSHNIIHRDISPENLMLRSQDNLPVLIDFGVVQETNAKLNSQMGIPASTVAGKAGYAPPEQLQSGNAYANSDLYALAVSSIVLLTGKEPPELFDSINLAWDWQKFTNVNPAFARVINQMLSYKPANRYRSAEEVTQALQVAQASFSGAKTYAVGRQVSSKVAATLPQRTVVAGVNNRNPENYPNNYPNNYDNSNQNRGNTGNGINWFVGILIILIAGVGSWAVTSLIFGRNQITPTPNGTAIASPTTPSNNPNVTNINTSIDLKSISEGINSGSVSDKISAGQLVNVRFNGEKEQLLTVSLTGADLQMTIQSDDQVGLDRKAIDNATGYWQGRLKKDGVYYIKIKTTATNETTYKLDVKLDAPPPPKPIPTKTSTPTPTAKPTLTIPSESPTTTPTPNPTSTSSPTFTPRDPIPTSSPTFTPRSTEPTVIPIEPTRSNPPSRLDPNPTPPPR